MLLLRLEIRKERHPRRNFCRKAHRSGRKHEEVVDGTNHKEHERPVREKRLGVEGVN